ncbi:hypothetical protein TNCV_1029431 [Trichonephila clavipes]|nr:hypothetical protein TNCV_1029431 [Trichonephila clavipes]
MVGNVFFRRYVALFTRAFMETRQHYRSHLSCHRPQKKYVERFTNTELAHMQLIYGLTEENARATEQLYCERYPQKDTPDVY